MAVPSDSPSCLNSLPAHIPNVEELVVSPLPQRLATRAYSLAVEIMNWNLVLLVSAQRLLPCGKEEEKKQKLSDDFICHCVLNMETMLVTDIH